MCAVSAILDYGRTTWGTIPDFVIPGKTWDSYQELVRKAKEYDRITGQPDCPDPAKETWYKDIERRMKELEKKVDNNTE